jgi:serine/threonine protein phosphatase PrpC
MDSITVNGSVDLRVAGLSTTGTSHLRLGVPCQDACGWFATKDMIAVAVADGAGSAPQSQLGSAVAVRDSIASLLHARVAAEDWTDCDFASRLCGALQAAKIGVERQASAISVQPSDLACTLLIAVGITGGTMGAAQIGDGAVIIENKFGDILALTSPTSGEHLNETTFITSARAIQSAQIRVQKDVTHFAVLTDGLQMISLRMPAAVPHHQFFSPLFRLLSSASEEKAQAAIEALLFEKRVTDRTDDDLTLVVASLDT